MTIKIEFRQDDKLYKLRNKAYLDFLAEGGSIALYVRGMSMYPFIKDYDLLRLESLVGKSVGIGDIVLVSKNGGGNCSFFIHRLVKIRNKDGIMQYYTKPDNSTRMLEGPFLEENINARVASIKRKVITLNLRSPLVIFISRLSALLSRNCPALLKIINYIHCLILERSLLFSKFIKHFKSKGPIFFNTQELFILLFNNLMSKDIKNKAIDLIAEGINWENFCDIALASSNLYKISTALRQLSNFVEIPDSALERLNNAHLKIIVETTRYHRELLYILREFSTREISVIPLKGTYLSERLYKDISSRGISLDSDLLVKEQDLGKVCDLMNNLGYKEALDEEPEPYHWHKDFFKKGSYPIDLHWDITMTNRSRERTEGFWQEAEKITVVEKGEVIDFYQWPDEALLIYICVNLINSKGYRNLRYFSGIKILPESSRNFNWQKFIDLAYKYKVNNSVYASLVKTKEILFAKVPLFVLAKIRPSLAKRLLINIFLSRRVIFENCLRRKFLDGFLSYIFFELLEATSLRDLLKIAKRVFFPPRKSLELSSYIPASNRHQNLDWQHIFCVLKRFCRASYRLVKILLG